MVLGLKFAEAKLFDHAHNSDVLVENNQSHSFDDNYEENLSDALTEEQIEFIEKGNKIYLSILLQQILKGHNSMAVAKVEAYKKFKQELKEVKNEVYHADSTKKLFKKFFVSGKEDLKRYKEAPSGENLKALCYFDQYLMHPKKQYDEWIKELKKVLSKDSELYKALENKTLLRILNTTDNASIPMQISKYEAEKILKNQQKYHPEITNEMIEKVVDLIQFRIPYYVGPLVKDSENAKFGWMKRNDNKPIKPWDFDALVNRSESATQFIRRMTNKCTYLLNEDVIPKNSLLYQEMEVLNELSNIQVRRETDAKSRKYRLTPELKNFAVEHIFKKFKTVSHKKFLEIMLNSNFRAHFMNHGEKLSLFGTQNEKGFGSKLSSYQDMIKIFGTVDDKREMIEEIIQWITIFEDKKILVEKLQQNYPELTTVQVNQLKNLNYSGWGRLSERLLTHRHHHHTIIELLRSSNENFMEIITNEAYDFQGFIQSENELSSSSIRYQDVEELSTSPALKKGIWSTVKLVRELTSIFGTPEKIIIEFAKEDQIKGRRSKTLKQMWENNVKKKGLKSDEAFRDIIKEANQLSQTQFQNENIKLYLSQNGKCMYSGKKIDIHALLSKQSDKYYEVDHIIPRSFIKDDSIDNKVLVIKEMNQNKYDRVPLQFVQNPDEKIAFWKSLNKAGLISDHKLFRLMKPQFTEMDKEGFIQRQLVETRQISVHVRDFLQEEYPNSRIIPMKAKMVSEFRRRFKIPKIRELNDAHHAIDAYLNGVVYHGAQLAYPKVDLFDFNFKWEKVREKWKALGEFSTNQKSKELFFFKALEKLTVNSGKLLIEKVYNDIDHFKINYSRKRVDTEKQFYDQMPVSPKISIPKYQSDKTEFAVYQSMKVHQTHVVAMKIANKKGNIKLKYQIIDEYVIEHYKFGENNEKALALHLAQRENNNEIVAAQIVYTLYRGDLLYIEGHPCYFISSDEVINAKQFELPLSKQRELKDTIKNQNMTIEKLKEMYQFLAKQLIVEYREYLNVDGENKKSKEILGLFSQIKQTHDDYINAIGEIFKAAKASSARSEKIGSRRNGMGTRTFLGLGTDVKVGYTSITGLKTTKPKSLFKLAESNNEL